MSSYSVAGEDYSADFLTETERSQIVNWTTIDKPTGVLKPNESVKVHYTVKAPKTASAGGQYAPLLVSSDDSVTESESVSINNVFEMASILYTKVNGDLIHEREILGTSVPGFVTQMPIKVSATLKNDGNIHEMAYISLEVRSYFSSQNLYPKAGESGTVEEMIMPGTTRNVTREISDVAPLGIYDVTQTVSYMGDSVMNHQTVVVCPIWFMALIFVTFTAIVLFIVRAVKKRRSGRVL